MVASLPEHAHLFAEHGCFGGNKDGKKIHVDCSDSEVNLTPLPDNFKALKVNKAMDDAWIKLLEDNHIVGA